MEYRKYAAYRIVSAATGRVLDVPDCTIRSADADLCADTGCESQQWFLERQADGKCLLKNICTSQYLSSGDSLVEVLPEGISQEYWRLEEAGELCTISSSRGFLGAGEEGKLSIIPLRSPASMWRVERVCPDYPVPEPKPASTGRYIPVMQMCSLWKDPKAWEPIRPFPKAKPLLGYYEEGTPETIDWEIKMAVDNGIKAFMPCWYRTAGNEGKPVQASYTHWVDGLQQARYKEYIQYMLMWENANAVACGVKDEADLLENVMPYFIREHFSKEQYFRYRGKPVLAVYLPSLLIEQLGGAGRARVAFEKAEQLCVEAGLNGLILLGQYCWGGVMEPHLQMKRAGFSYTMSYHWPSFAEGALEAGKRDYTDNEILKGHRVCWNGQNMGALPNIINCSVGWNSAPWGHSCTDMEWKLKPRYFYRLLNNAKAEMDNRPKEQMDADVVFLDNWNEFGEGHYIMPTAQFGYGYLFAIKRTFADTYEEAGEQGEALHDET